MPFIKRIIHPKEIRRHDDGDTSVFEDHDDAVNHTLVKALKQMSSLTIHAEDIFKEIEDEFTITFRRCERVNKRLNNLFETIHQLNPKEVQIPMSDLDTEQKIPVYLHYHSCDSVEDDLFTTDTRTPCLIHLHTTAGGDLNSILQGSKAYAKPARPKSFDPNMLLQDSSSSRKFASSKSTTNIIASPELNELYNPQQLLPTPRQKMELESAQHLAQVVTVDTSGAQFERRANLRRSQRSSNSSVRRKSQQKFRERHRTLTAMPGCISQELAPRRIRHLRPSGLSRPSSLHSDVNSNSSFVGDGSVLTDFSGSPRAESRNAEIQTEDVKILPATPNKRKMKYRNSSPVGKSAPTTPSGGARVSLQEHVDVKNAFPNDQVVHNYVEHPRVSASMTTNHVINGYKNDFMREKNSLGDDRLSSGFWSGTESTRHSATSDILLQHHNVTLALQQVLTTKKSSQGRQPERDAELNHRARDRISGSPLVDTKMMSLSTSTLSLNSHLSTLDQSSVVSLGQSSVAPTSDVSANPNYATDSSLCVPRSEMGTPCQLTFGTPGGAYNFMNPNYEETKPNFGSKLDSPMDLLILGNRRRNDGMIRDDSRSLNSSIFSQDQDGYYTSMHKDSGVDRRLESLRNMTSPGTFHSERSSDVFSSTPVEDRKQFFGKDFKDSSPGLEVKQPLRHVESPLQPPINSQYKLQSELIQKLGRRKTSPQKPQRTNSSRPPPPRRASSLYSPRYSTTNDPLVYMEPLSDGVRDMVDGCVVETIHPPRTSIVNSAEQSSHQTPLSSTPLNTINPKPVENGYHPSVKPYRKPSRADSFKRAISKQGKRPESMMESPKEHASPRRPLSVNIDHQMSLQSLRLSPNASAKPNSPISPRPPSNNSIDSKKNYFAQQAQQEDKQAHGQSKSIVAKSPTNRTASTKTLTNGFHGPNRLSPNTTPLQEKSPEKQPLSKKKFVPPTGSNIASLLSKSPDKRPSSPVTTSLPEKRPLSPTMIPSTLEKEVSLRSPVSPVRSLSPGVKSISPRPWSPDPKPATRKPLSILTKTPTTSENKEIGDITSPKSPTVVKPVISKKPTNLPTSPRATTNSQAAPLQQLNQNTKPPVKPKPTLKPKPSIAAKENKQSSEQQQTAINKQDRVSVKNANARAAFFGQFNADETEMGKSISKNKKPKQETPPVVEKKELETKEIESSNELPTENENKLEETFQTENVTGNLSEKKSNIFSFPETVNETEVIEVTAVSKSSDVVQQLSPIDDISTTEHVPSEPRKSPVATCIDFELHDVTNNGVKPDTDSKEDKCEIETDIDSVPLSENVTLSPIKKAVPYKPIITNQKSILSSELRASVQKLRNGNRTPTSPISSPSSGSVGESPVLSPVSTLERRKNGRYSLSSLDRRRKISSGGTSRDDFKTLLLQSFSKSSGSSMSATEKLSLANQQNLSRSFSEGDDLNDAPKDTPRPSIVSVGDLKAVMNPGRHGRRTTRHHTDKLNGVAGFAALKHPPMSSSARRYGTRSRTPTRPMQSITEENDILPDKISNQRSASVTNL